VSDLERLDHVSLNVRDRAAAIAWYRETLGLEQQNEPSEDAEPVFMGRFGACIALFQAEVSSPPRAPESSGLRHVAFALSREGFDDAQEHLRKVGVEPRVEDHGNAHSLYFPDPDGNVVELTTYLR
jgi:catechol-2,3-dioxygenase